MEYSSWSNQAMHKFILTGLKTIAPTHPQHFCEWSPCITSAIQYRFQIHYIDALRPFLTVLSYHVTYAFQSESTLNSYLNIKEFLARSRHEIWSFGDGNGTRSHNHLGCKRTLNHLAKCRCVQMQSLKIIS